MNLDQPLHNYTYVAFDTETSGAYPVGHDIVEFGAVKYSQGQEIDRLQFLFKPREPMTDFIIGIHGISNEMVANAPMLSEKIHEIHRFMQGSVVMAHHAPFDLGFLALEFEKSNLPVLAEPALCTSLLSRKWIHGVQNHKLQTLVKHLNLDGGQAHRAYDDAKACLHVGLECFKRMDEKTTLADAIKSQGKNLWWKDYLLWNSSEAVVKVLKEAILTKKKVDLAYDGGSTRGEVRQVEPIGIVRNPDGDYLMAHCLKDKTNKRYYLSRITDAAVIF